MHIALLVSGQLQLLMFVASVQATGTLTAKSASLVVVLPNRIVDNGRFDLIAASFIARTCCECLLKVLYAIANATSEPWTVSTALGIG